LIVVINTLAGWGENLNAPDKGVDEQGWMFLRSAESRLFLSGLSELEREIT